jgi:NAD-dependent DNA ligase
MLADGKLTDDEILFLNNWLAENGEIAGTWPGDVLFRRVQKALSAGRISDAERAHLQETLSDLIGGSLPETGAVSGGSTRLPLTRCREIIIPQRNFCFTGQFLFGTRDECEEVISARGGYTTPRVTKNLDYLVIGQLASQAWSSSSHGRKIEKAVSYRTDGCAIEIVDEAMFVAAIVAVTLTVTIS